MTDFVTRDEGTFSPLTVRCCLFLGWSRNGRATGPTPGKRLEHTRSALRMRWFDPRCAHHPHTSANAANLRVSSGFRTLVLTARSAVVRSRLVLKWSWSGHALTGEELHDGSW